ncbi:hypothetical protein ACJMK2_024452 [Sinanodonta woodiana]|uniref:Uncharacterized protein n=1 Tax=Sinanodonta woodiana TaxID=1069815 RepID=A0ABD3XDE6_SINWO
MSPTHVLLLIVITCVTAFVYGDGGKPPKVCKYSSDGPVCRSNTECSDPEVHCYRKPGQPYGRCCVKRPYACPIGRINSNRYGDPEGFPPLVHRCPPYPFFCHAGYHCRTQTGGPTEFYGVCCPLMLR